MKGNGGLGRPFWDERFTIKIKSFPMTGMFVMQVAARFLLARYTVTQGPGRVAREMGMRHHTVVVYRMRPMYPADQFRTVPAEITSAASVPFRPECQRPTENPTDMSFGLDLPLQ